MTPPPPPSYQGIGFKTGMRPIAEINTNTNNNSSSNKKSTTTNIKTKNKTRTIRISEELYKKFCEHSRRYYNTETYEVILSDLLDEYEKHNNDKHWWDNNN